MMKRVFAAFLISLTACFYASAEQPLRCGGTFSMKASSSLENYGYIDSDGKIYGTDYAGFKIEPDWRFANHFGLKTSLGAAWAFSTNSTGVWERPIYSICNASLAVTPYYEFTIGKYFIDLGAVVACRLRLPYMNTEPSKYLMTVSASAGADVSAGYNLTDKWSCFMQFQARRTFYDYLYAVDYPSKGLPITGCIITSLGLSYRF